MVSGQRRSTRIDRLGGDAGRAWGRHLVNRAAPSERVDRDEAVARLNKVLDEIGFQPEVQHGRSKRETEVRQHNCPFREVAERHTDVVCAIHVGLMQGALDELRAPVEEPFVTPNHPAAQRLSGVLHYLTQPTTSRPIRSEGVT